MASSANSAANLASASGTEPLLSAQRDSMHSVLDAVIGLTSLAAPISPSISSPSPSICNDVGSNASKAPSQPSCTSPAAGFGAPCMPFNPDFTTPFSRNGAAATAPKIPARPSFPYWAYENSTSPLPLPSSLPKPPFPNKAEPVNNTDTKNFPETLLEVISSEEHSHIISWLPHGRGFAILDMQRFVSIILPQYFDGAKFTSFTRRLKRWGFVRVPRGTELGAYYNENFVRGRPELVQKMGYRKDGQFEEAKKKNGKSKRQMDMEEGGKVQQGLSNKVHAKRNNESPRLHTREEYQQLQQHILSAYFPARKKHFADQHDQDRPMPLPSTLPKRPQYDVTHKKKTKAKYAAGPSTKKAAHATKEAVTICRDMKRLEIGVSAVKSPSILRGNTRSAAQYNLFQRMKRLENCAAATGSPMSPTPGHSKIRMNSAVRNAFVEQRLGEIELEVARSAPFGRVGRSLATSGNVIAADTRSVSAAGESVFDHRHCTLASVAQGINEIDCSERTLETMNGLGGSRRGLVSTGNNFPAVEGMSSNDLRQDIIAAVVHDLESRLASPFARLPKGLPLRGGETPQASIGKSLDGSRLVLMSQESQEEFTRYLSLKKNHYLGSSVTQR